MKYDATDAILRLKHFCFKKQDHIAVVIFKISRLRALVYVHGYIRLKKVVKSFIVPNYDIF